MIPLWVLSFSKCSVGSGFQLWTGHYMSRHSPSCDRHSRRQTGTEVQGNRVIPTCQLGGIALQPQLVSCPLLPRGFGRKRGCVQ